MDHKSRKSPLFYSVSIIILLITGCALLIIQLNIGDDRSPCLDIQRSSSAKVPFFVQDIKTILKAGTKSKTSKNDEVWPMRMRQTLRRLLSGPGSSPPHCTGKCSQCSPCKPIRVLIPPGTSVPTEYYPEAWRCKCGNKYYMP